MKNKIKDFMYGTAAVIGVFIMAAGALVLAKEIRPEEPQDKAPGMEIIMQTKAENSPYIVRYGTWEEDVIVTEDGNIWGLQDPPIHMNGTNVRVVFDGNGTETPYDDIIIDLTETNH